MAVYSIQVLKRVAEPYTLVGTDTPMKVTKAEMILAVGEKRAETLSYIDTEHVVSLAAFLDGWAVKKFLTTHGVKASSTANDLIRIAERTLERNASVSYECIGVLYALAHILQQDSSYFIGKV